MRQRDSRIEAQNGFNTIIENCRYREVHSRKITMRELYIFMSIYPTWESGKLVYTMEVVEDFYSASAPHPGLKITFR